jgi:hypothetical protein
VIKDNQDFASGWSASCSCLVKETSGGYRIHTGDYIGARWKLEIADKNDNSNGYYAGLKHPYLSFDNNRLTKRYDYIRAVIKPVGNFDLNVSVSIDGSVVMTGVMSMAGTGGALDSFVLDTDILGGNDLLDHELRIGAFGKRIQAELYNSSANEDFFISQVQYDYKPTTVAP